MAQLSSGFLQAQGSCQSELHRALERLAASQTRTHEDLYVIPIPNCDRNGNFHPKQVGRAGGCSSGGGSAEPGEVGGCWGFMGSSPWGAAGLFAKAPQGGTRVPKPPRGLLVCHIQP